eukprot:jgi/Psemu1/285545/fgenesh1_pg.93_\
MTVEMPKDKKKAAAQYIMGYPVRELSHEDPETEIELVDDALIKRFQLFRGVVEHEENLVYYRMCWILMVQAMLMVAFMVSSAMPDSKLVRTIAGIGLAVCVLTLQPMLASLININNQKRNYYQGLPDDRLCQKLHGIDRDMKWNSSDEEVWVNRAYFHLLPTLTYRSWYYCEGQNFPVWSLRCRHHFCCGSCNLLGGRFCSHTMKIILTT